MKRIHMVAALAVLAASFGTAPVHADLLQSSGRITFLRVHDVGTGFGPPSDFIDVEVVVQINTKPGESFGFQLRNDANRPLDKECSTCFGTPSIATELW